jgi:hypothetical protein
MCTAPENGCSDSMRLHGNYYFLLDSLMVVVGHASTTKEL